MKNIHDINLSKRAALGQIELKSCSIRNPYQIKSEQNSLMKLR